MRSRIKEVAKSVSSSLSPHQIDSPYSQKGNCISPFHKLSPRNSFSGRREVISPFSECLHEINSAAKEDGVSPFSVPSPAIDFSFFMFLNASPELWANCWDDMFSIYHHTLLDAISEFLNRPQEALRPEFSLEAFKHQFSKYCLYGFMLATSFIIGQTAAPDRVKAFDLFNDDVPSVEELESFTKKIVELANDGVINRVLSLTQELLNKISL
jgi:hypothetical protein